MAITATQIITDALTEIGVLAEGDTPSTQMLSDGLRSLNRLLDYLSNDQAFAYYPNEIQRALTGEASFTVGPTGNVATTRPISIESAWVVRDSISYPVRVVDNRLWDGIVYPAAAGANTALIWYEAQMDNGIVHVWPLCTGATLHMRVVNQVVNFAALSTSVNLPPGYEECITSNLAIRLSPQYPSVQVSPVTVKYARDSLKVIKRRNNVIPTLSLPGVVLTDRSGFSLANFLSGT